jgi:hypothetical protein
MTPTNIMNTLSSLGIAVGVRGDNLIVSPKSKVPPFLVGELQRHKTEILSLVLEAKAGKGNPSVSVSVADLQSLSVADIQSLLGKDIAVGFYKPPGKGQPKVPINGRGTTVLEASGLCSPSCAHEFHSLDQEACSGAEQGEIL